MSYDGKCYKLFVPVSEKQSKVQDIGYSKAEALEHCLKRGGKLLDISSQVKYSKKYMIKSKNINLKNSHIWYFILLNINFFFFYKVTTKN